MKVAFASCCHRELNYQHQQPIWSVIQKQNPDLLLLLGDTVYLGSCDYDREKMEEIYKKQTEELHFKKILEEVPYLVVWDNHDFGLDGDEWGVAVGDSNRRMARGLFNQYLKYGSKRPFTNEVYCSYVKENVKFIMLDVRSHQQDPSGNNPSLLGTVQEEWLENEMLNSTAEINVICSGIPFNIDGDTGGWKSYTNWYNRFSNIAARTSKPIFLGGNIHVNKFRQHIVSPDPITSGIASGVASVTGILPPGSQYLFEAVSSGVGQNFKTAAQLAIDTDIAMGDIQDAPVVDGTFAGLPRNNYGIIDFTPTVVKIFLYSQARNSMLHAEIKKDEWTLQGYWEMLKTNPH